MKNMLFTLPRDEQEKKSMPFYYMTPIPTPPEIEIVIHPE